MHTRHSKDKPRRNIKLFLISIVSTIVDTKISVMAYGKLYANLLVREEQGKTYPKKEVKFTQKKHPKQFKDL